MNLNGIIASNIKQNRRQKNFKSAYVAQFLNVSISAYSKLENGKINITMSHVERIAKCFNISVRILMDMDKEDLNHND